MDKVGEYTLTVMKKAKWYNNWLLSQFIICIKGDVLEIGAGIGNFTPLLAKCGSVTVIDINKDYIEKFNVPRVINGFGDIEKGEYFFKDKKFDTVVCLNVIEHIKEDEKAFGNVFKLLNNGGMFIILVPAHKSLYSRYDKLLGHYRRYGVSELDLKLKSCGYSVNRINYINWWGALGWLIFVRILNSPKFPDKEVGIFDYFGRFLLWPEKIVRFPFGLSVLAIAEKPGN